MVPPASPFTPIREGPSSDDHNCSLGPQTARGPQLTRRNHSVRAFDCSLGPRMREDFNCV